MYRRLCLGVTMCGALVRGWNSYCVPEDRVNEINILKYILPNTSSAGLTSVDIKIIIEQSIQQINKVILRINDVINWKDVSTSSQVTVYTLNICITLYSDEVDNSSHYYY